MKKTLIAATLLSLFSSQYATASDETTELRQIIEQQQKVLKDLEKRLEQTEKRVETTADVVESTASSKSATTIGGYGELHYNNITDNSITARITNLLNRNKNPAAVARLQAERKKSNEDEEVQNLLEELEMRASLVLFLV